jgi:hypothetical protein
MSNVSGLCYKYITVQLQFNELFVKCPEADKEPSSGIKKPEVNS